MPILASSPAPDADVSPVWSSESAAPNPVAKTDVTGWATSSGTLSRVTGQNQAGILPAANMTAFQVAWTSGTGQWGLATPVADTMPRANAGEWHTLSAFLWSSVARDCRIGIVWYEASGTTFTELTQQFVTSAALGTTYRRVSVTALAPARATHARLVIQAVTNGAAGNTIRATGIMLTREQWLTDYYDGDTTNTATYAYRWNGVAHAVGSTSERICLVDERTPDAFRWDSGATAWEFLEPFTAGAGLRLFCDEQRVWRLIDPAEYSVPGVVSLSPAAATEGIDRISRDDPEVYCTGVIVRYSWRDGSGVDRSRVDTAGEPGLVLAVEIDRPYPGAGVAAAILARRTGQGRVQEVTALARWTVTPSQQANVSLPGALDQLGQLEAVEWGLSDGLMTVKTRALTDVRPGSINSLAGTINALTGTINAL